MTCEINWIIPYSFEINREKIPLNLLRFFAFLHIYKYIVIALELEPWSIALSIFEHTSVITIFSTFKEWLKPNENGCSENSRNKFHTKQFSWLWFLWASIFGLFIKANNANHILPWSYRWSHIRGCNHLVRKKWKSSIQNSDQSTFLDHFLAGGCLYSFRLHSRGSPISNRASQHFLLRHPQLSQKLYLVLHYLNLGRYHSPAIHLHL